MNKSLNKALLTLGLIGALVLACLASIAFGVREITAADVWAALQGSTETASHAAAYQRIPRTIAALLAGAALAVAGTSMQAITRNPLADPGVFGVLAGASLAVVIVLVLLGAPSQGVVFLAAVIGAGLAAAFVYAVGSRGRSSSPLTLALAGAATAAALTSLSTALVLPRSQSLDSYRQWVVGGVGGTDFADLRIAGPVLLIVTLASLALAGAFNALALGDETATSLGHNVTRIRALGWATAAVLAGVVTALCGPIAFVGLVVPHLVRLLVGGDHRWLLPQAALAGALLLVATDTIGRLVNQPAEVPVGVITPLIGAPVFIWIVRSMKTRSV